MHLQHLNFEAIAMNWRHGDGWAERMAARYLALQGYTDIIPQSPLGGPDGGKDVRFATLYGTGLAACYFPTKERSFAKIKKKFEADWENASKNSPVKFYFITGQRLTPTQEEELKRIPVVETVIVDVDALLVQITHLMSYADGSARPLLSDFHRANDVSCLRRIIGCCPFFKVPEFTDMAPKSFGDGFLEADELRIAINCGIIYFYDQLLDSLVKSWWYAWDDLIQQTSTSYFLKGYSGAHYPESTHFPLGSLSYGYAQDQAIVNLYLSDISDMTDTFRQHHVTLLSYLREFYPDAMPLVESFDFKTLSASY